MPAEPQVGDAFRQEYYAGEAEDMGEIPRSASPARSASATRRRRRDDHWKPLEPDIEEKWYARGVGTIYEEAVAGGDELVELIEFTPARESADSSVVSDQVQDGVGRMGAKINRRRSQNAQDIGSGRWRGGRRGNHRDRRCQRVVEGRRTTTTTETAISGDALEQASDAALDYTGGGRVTGSEVDDEESKYEIEVTLDNGDQVDVQLDENSTSSATRTTAPARTTDPHLGVLGLTRHARRPGTTEIELTRQDEES